MLDVITPEIDEEHYLMQIANQIARYFTQGSLLNQYHGAIPLLDAYYYYGKATAEGGMQGFCGGAVSWFHNASGLRDRR